MDEAPTSGESPEPPQAAEETTTPSESNDTPEPGEESAEPFTRPRRRRDLQPWQALERLDRQWEDPTPIAQIGQTVTALALTTAEDPRGWDYIGALTGAAPDDVATACGAWLEAQLAADAVGLGESLRPRVELVPAGRLWFVVRTVADIILVIDGPGFLTPVAAAVAASRRYHFELLRKLERARTADAHQVNDEGTDRAPEEAEQGTDGADDVDDREPQESQ